MLPACAKALARLTKVDSLRKREQWITWYTVTRLGAPKQFQQAYDRWKNLKAQLGEEYPVIKTVETVYVDASKSLSTRVTTTEFGRAYNALKDVGIDTLPLIVEKLKEGDYDLLPIFEELTDGEGARPGGGWPKDRAEFAVQWWEEHKQDWLVPPSHQDEDGP